MKQAKTFKIILFITSLLMFILAGFGFLMPKTAFAESAKFFTGNVVLDGTNAVATLKNDESVKLNNTLAINDLAIGLKASNDTSEITIKFDTDSFSANGYISGENLKTTVSHSLKIKNDGKLVFNGEEANITYNKEMAIKFKVEGSFIKVSVGGEFIGSNAYEYKVKNVGVCEVKNMSFSITSSKADGDDLTFTYIDQDYTDTNGNYKQTFTATEGELQTKAKAKIVAINDSLYVNTESGMVAKVAKYKQYTLKFNAYSVTEKINTSDLYLQASEGTQEKVWLSSEDKPKSIVFIDANSVDVKLGNDVVDTLTFELFDKENITNTTPKYIASEAEINAYKMALKEATFFNEDGADYNVRIGDKVKVPSLEGLVADDYSSYKDLSYTLHYETPKTSGSTSSLEIYIDSAGDYKFYVVFKDELGESMEKEDFEAGKKYASYTFTFSIEDNAPIKIVPVVQSSGYVGTKYTVSAFKISPSNYTPTYELYYTSNESLVINPKENWEKDFIKIPNASSVNENTEGLPEGFTYEDIQTIGYEGGLTFTPTKEGKYVIKCTVSSDMSVKTQSHVATVSIKDRPITVKPASDWLQQNVWSVVFLSVGTLCLIAIVALLFVKPKENADNND